MTVQTKSTVVGTTIPRVITLRNDPHHGIRTCVCAGASDSAIPRNTNSGAIYSPNRIRSRCPCSYIRNARSFRARERCEAIIRSNEREEKFMKNTIFIGTGALLLLFGIFFSCESEISQPMEMLS